MPIHPIVELNGVNVIACQRRHAIGRIVFIGRKVGEETMARRARPIRANIQRRRGAREYAAARIGKFYFHP